MRAIWKSSLLGLIAACLLLAACGRPGLPRLPQGVSDRYPGGYPQGAKAPEGTILKDPQPKDAR